MAQVILSDLLQDYQFDEDGPTLEDTNRFLEDSTEDYSRLHINNALGYIGMEDFKRFIPTKNFKLYGRKNRIGHNAK